MLKELYDYALNQNLPVMPGMGDRSIKAYISIDEKGQFIDFVPAVKNTVYCPDMGTFTQGDKSNVILDKAENVLNLNDSAAKKHDFFIESLKDAAGSEPDLLLFYNILSNNEKLRYLQEEFAKTNFKSNDVIGFMLNMKPIYDSENIRSWWSEFRRTKLPNNSNKPKGVCFITGKPTQPAKTVPKTTGLAGVGGRATSDTLVCFDKTAFQSYGFSGSNKGYNCTLSDKAITGVNMALEKLIKEAPRMHAGLKLVNWYRGKNNLEEDIFSVFSEGFLMENLNLTIDSENKDDTNIAEDERESKRQIKALFSSIYRGTIPEQLKDYRYYLIPISGAGGRVMIRGYDEGSCEELYKSFHLWYEELQLYQIGSSGKLYFPNIDKIFVRLLKPQSERPDSFKNYDRIPKEISGLSVKIVNSIVHHTALPDSIAQKALKYIESELLTESNNKFQKVPDYISCQILKVWLIRKGFDKMNKELNESYDGVGYQLGRLMAVYGAIQKRANPEVNTGIVEKYFVSASSTPAFVLGKLAALSNHHMEKLSESEAVYFRKLLQEVSVHIKLPLPKTMDIVGQSEFAIGYYQQCAKMFTKKVTEENN